MPETNLEDLPEINSDEEEEDTKPKFTFGRRSMGLPEPENTEDNTEVIFIKFFNIAKEDKSNEEYQLILDPKKIPKLNFELPLDFPLPDSMDLDINEEFSPDNSPRPKTDEDDHNDLDINFSSDDDEV